MFKINIAIDGPSSGGKSTMARALARQIGYTYIDTGAMYRAVTLHALRSGVFRDGVINEDALRTVLPRTFILFRLNPQTGFSDTYLNEVNVESDIRSMEVAAQVSYVAAIPFVRKALVSRQRALGRRKGVVMDGRDIGSVVIPDAELKVFVTAPPEVRAQRRYKELQDKGLAVTYEEVLQNIVERDRMDSTRKDSPLAPPPDSYILNNAGLSIEEQLHILTELFKERLDRFSQRVQNLQQ
ncbi:MAG: (d)CMP kinase [Tannerellaceae bacterium]|nr:(d)CMP kinase [Tannerellaceae bacterium]